MSHYICEDIVVKVLRLLSVKSLLRLQCVSKRIKEIIESHSFVVDHLFLRKNQIFAQPGLAYNDSKFLVINPNNGDEEFIKDPIQTQRLFLLGTMHGVVCLYGICDSGFRLWNPSTRQLSSHHMIDNRSFIRYTGFWIDPLNKDFKVILFGFHSSNVSNEAILYKSAEKSQVKIPLGDHTQKRWRGLHEIELSLSPALMIGGMAYWTCYKDAGMRKNLVILSFDFGRETFDQIEKPMPDTLNLVLCKWQENLSLMYWTKSAKLEYKCNIYSRRDGSWVDMFSFNLKLSIPICRVSWALGLGEMERVVFCFWSRNYTAMFLYDTSRGLLSSKNVNYYIMAHDFVESLLFP